jgi:uncharacterized protein YbcC (UPF0753/DUF2309 family)
VLCSYLDQGIAMWNFPVWHRGFLSSVREMERNSYTSFFKTPRARMILLEGHHSLKQLLRMVVGRNESLYEHYLFDQQFAHQGWSGMVASVEDNPHTLLDHRKITLHDVIMFELMLEIDALDRQFGENWKPLDNVVDSLSPDLLAPVEVTELDEVTTLWQEAFEWSYYDEVLAAIRGVNQPEQVKPASFQAMFCIDDRECSFRRYLEKGDPRCETFGTPGFFGVEFFFQPDHGKFYTKLCPAPVTPKYLIKEIGVRRKHKKDAHFTKDTHTLFSGWLITQTLGFWSALKLFLNIFKPSSSPATASSFHHMVKYSRLTI